MRKALREIQEIEQYCQGQLSDTEQEAFETRLILEPELEEKLHWQQDFYQWIKYLSRKLLKKEIQATENQLFTQHQYRNFQEQIEHIF